jgi:ABC-type antimicrobial peptide transport system permease subunit
MLLGSFAAFALLLACFGVYAVISYSVGQRQREIGIRMALGAAQHDVLWMVLRETLTLALIGVAIGLGCAWPLTKLVQTQLFGIAPSDFTTMAAASFGIAAVTALAGFIPAKRATTIDPIRALRWE